MFLAVGVDSNNIKWFITSDSVIKYWNSEWQIFSSENGLPAGSLTTLAIDNNNTIWIGTQKQGIISFDGSEWVLYDQYKPDITAIDVDSNNRIWLGDFHGMVYSYNGNEWSSFRQLVNSYFYIP